MPWKTIFSWNYFYENSCELYFSEKPFTISPLYYRQLETYYDEWVHEGWFPSQHHEFEEYEEQLYGPHGPFPEAVGTVGKLDEQVPYDAKHVPAGANADYMAKLAAK